MNQNFPGSVYYEPASLQYELGERLIAKYKQSGVPCFEIENHNNIELMRKKPNQEFPKMKNSLIIGIRKTHKYVPNAKTSDFLVPYTSSGCSAMCLYCYLVCNYNKCAYLRVFVNREQMLEKLIKTANQADRPLTFEIGSNSDLVLENTITGNLPWTIERFGQQAKQGFITLPTKFDMVDSLLPLDHKGKTIIRMSVNPSQIIQRVEFGTSPLSGRIDAVNKLCEAGYQIGILIAPVILVDDWKTLYSRLVEELAGRLSQKAKQSVFFEIIFMTYSYVHNAINTEAFPNAIQLYDPKMMTGRGRGKYMYKPALREDGEQFFRQLMKMHFPDNRLWYIV